MRDRKSRKIHGCILIGFVVLYLLPYLKCSAQDEPVLLTDTIALKSVWLNKSPWKFHSGDSLQWAQPGFSDSSWVTLSETGFGRDRYSRAQVPQGWQGFGWFRLWVKKQDASSTGTWGLYLNHDAASEVYFDGKKIASLGKVGHSKLEMTAVREPYQCIPLAITDTLPHLLAIRYSNFREYYPNFVGFESSIQDLDTMNRSQKAEREIMGTMLMSVSVSAILVILHLLIYIFYPRQKIHLYYVLFVSIVGLGLYARYQTFVATDPADQVLATRVFLAFVTLHLSLGLLMLYQACYNRLPRRKTLVMLLCSWPVPIIAFTDWYEFWNNPLIEKLHNWYQVIFVLIFYTDAFVAMVRAIQKGNKKLWVIAVGMVLLVTVGTVVGSNMFGWFTTIQVMIAFAWGNLLMPVMFSIYLAIDVAAANRNLAVQLDLNEKLASENLAKEQEKSRLIAGQADRLEKTVLERTAQVRQQAEKLREMDAVKSRFFVNLTHEFKTPLNLIINPAKELLRQSKEAVPQRYAQFILQNSERLLQLINQLLDLSKLESGQLRADVQSVELVQWLSAYVQQHNSLAEHRNIRLHFSCDHARMWVQTDLDKIKKMVQNLLSNAIKFSNDDSEIVIVLDKTGTKEFTISVTDHGIGIPAGKLPFIFDRFYQVDGSDSRSREGAGIGLALTKELAVLLNGTITVNSVSGEGSTFILTLPYIESTGKIEIHNNDMEQIGPGRADQESDTRGLLQPEAAEDDLPLILLVEDNADLREFITLSFSEDYRVITASDGEEGIRMALEKIPSLVITDLMMPKKDGYQVCEALKSDERTSHIPIVMLTAKTDTDSRIQGIVTGADAYLAKPFDKRELVAVIENLVKVRKQLREKYGQQEVWLTGFEQLPSIEQKFLDKVRNAIADNIEDSSFGTDQLASEMALSRTQLHRKLKQLINQSPGEMIRVFRMLRANELLQQSAGTVAEVGYMVGYGNPANFSTSFTKHFGYPPSEAAKRF
ncbi:Signal transduction histidine kinase [Dyadobacter soli]|uniref:histidine kinase n=1 Tax=Dyadobacter soli TaxID=659014 RepID=A0A1G6VRR4_9BACT|nr:ATP-binding protein [Dyadobacter soli]SDD55677.1 Signal transduction histidine kinase [Dyadobacter soli]